MLVELKSGETLNGHLINCDAWMNLTLKEVVQTNSVSLAFLPHLWLKVSILINKIFRMVHDFFGCQSATLEETMSVEPIHPPK